MVYRISKAVLGNRYESAVKIIRVPTEEQYSQAKNSLHMDAPSLNRYFYEMVTAITEEVNIFHSLSGKSNILTYHDHKVIENEDHAG